MNGHEGAGTVLSVGSAVTRVQPGDEVLLSYANCAECGYCTMGRPAGCVGFMDRNFGRVRNPSVGAAPVGTLAGTDIPVHGKLLMGMSREGKRNGNQSERLTTRTFRKQGTFFGQSALARHCLAVETSVVKVPKGLDLALLAPLGCGLQSG